MKNLNGLKKHSKKLKEFFMAKKFASPKNKLKGKSVRLELN